MTKSTAQAVLATMHRKEQVIAPIINEELGIDIWVPDDFNTDIFGTFTGDIKRAGNQLDAARAKARAAMQKYDYAIGIASEGSFGVHPTVPFLQSNLELVVLLDDLEQVEVLGYARSSNNQQQTAAVHSVSELLDTATQWGFPAQGVLIKRSPHTTRRIYKEAITFDELRNAAQRMFRLPWVRTLWLETDMRAHRHISRMESIKAATVDLVRRYNQRCPTCTAPGYTAARIVEGVPCARCKLPSEVPKTQQFRCQRCIHTSVLPVVDAPASIEPGDCRHCNP